MTILAKIDVTKIDKSKLFKGAKGTYLDIVLFESQDHQYGNDFMVVQSVSAEERKAGKRGAILGNAKYAGGNAPKRAQSKGPAQETLDEDVPF